MALDMTVSSVARFEETAVRNARCFSVTRWAENGPNVQTNTVHPDRKQPIDTAGSNYRCNTPVRVVAQSGSASCHSLGCITHCAEEKRVARHCAEANKVEENIVPAL